jgi:hypothetical protein
MKNQKFFIIKNKNSEEIAYYEYDETTGYNIKPKNNSKIEDCINVNKMIIINPSLIQKVIAKKIKRRFDVLLNFLSDMYEDEEDNPEGLMQALTEIERIRSELINNNREYIDEKELDLIDKKLAILENEAKLRLFMYKEEKTNNKEGKSR